MKRYLVKAQLGNDREHTWECDTIDQAKLLAREIGTDGAMIGDEWSGVEFFAPQRVASVRAMLDPELVCCRCNRSEKIDGREQCQACWESVRCEICEDAERINPASCCADCKAEFYCDRCGDRLKVEDEGRTFCSECRECLVREGVICERCEDAPRVDESVYCADCKARLVCEHCLGLRFGEERDGRICYQCLAEATCPFCESAPMLNGSAARGECQPALKRQAKREQAARRHSKVFRYMEPEGYAGVAKPGPPTEDSGYGQCCVCNVEVRGPVYKGTDDDGTKYLCIECAVSEVHANEFRRNVPTLDGRGWKPWRKTAISGPRAAGLGTRLGLGFQMLQGRQ